MNKFGKAVISFAVDAWKPFVISYDRIQEIHCLENYICVQALRHNPVHGGPQGRAKRAFAPLEIGAKKQKFLENVKSGICF